MLDVERSGLLVHFFEIFLEWFLVLGGIATAAVLARKGKLSPSAFANSPTRVTGLAVWDLGLGVGVMFVGVVLVRVILVHWGWVPEDPNAPAQEATPQGMLIQALLGQLLLQLPVAGFTLWKSNAVLGGLKDLGVWPSRPTRDLQTGLKALGASLMMVLGLNVLLTALSQFIGMPVPDVGHRLLGALVESRQVWTVVGLMLSAVVLAPVLEECIFRGLVQTCMLSALGPRRRWTVVLVAAALFMGVHVELPWQVLPGIYLLGVVLGWLYEKTGSLMPGMLVHAGFNAFNVAMVLILGSE